MDVVKRKNEILNDLDRLEDDIKILQNNIKKCRELLAPIETDADIEKFDNDFDIEEGLEIICLFGQPNERGKQMATNIDDFAAYYFLAKNKIRLKLWSVDYAKGYLSCYLNNALVVNDFVYDEYAKMIDELGE